MNVYKDEILIQKFKIKKTILFGTNYNIKVNDLKENYNKFNRGVDVFDQKLQITSMQRKTVKWYKKVILFGIEASIINSKIICDGLYGEKENTNQYKEKIILYIFKRYQEYQHKAEELSNINNNYIPINYRKKIHNL